MAVMLYFLVLPFLLFIPFFYKKSAEKTYKLMLSKCIQPVTGICIRKYSRIHKYTRINSKTASHVFFYNTWQYEYNGQIYKSTIDEFKEFWADEGIQATIMMNPCKPNEIILPRTKEMITEVTSKRCRNNIFLGIVLWILVGIALYILV